MHPPEIMKLENTISTFQRLREENGSDQKVVVEKGKEEEGRLMEKGALAGKIQDGETTEVLKESSAHPINKVIQTPASTVSVQVASTSTLLFANARTCFHGPFTCKS